MREKREKIKEIILNHIKKNKNEYLLVTTIFIIGLLFGVMLVNKLSDVSIIEVKDYLNDYILKIKEKNDINIFDMVKSSISRNGIIAVIIWFLGTTVIGIPIVLFIIAYRGFCFGYTISVITRAIGIKNAIGFLIDTLLIQNILFIPALIGLGVSGLKLYKKIIKRGEIDNIKVEVIRHTFFCFIMLIVFILAAVLEIIISFNLIRIFGNKI